MANEAHPVMANDRPQSAPPAKFVVIIAAEGRGRTVRQILEQVRASQGDIEIGLSVVTVAELVHGAYRAGTPT